MYFLQHYIIDWDKVKDFDDLKRIIQCINISFDVTYDTSEIKDLLVLVPKEPVRT